MATASGEVGAPSARAQSGLQVHNRYLITEDEAGVVIIDQHALHERILYEQLREKVLSGSLERQRLLVPEPVQLTAAEAAAALDARATLAQLGIDIEDFGSGSILVAPLHVKSGVQIEPGTVVEEGKTPGTGP